MAVRQLVFAPLLTPFALAVSPLVDVGYTRYQGTVLQNGITQWLGLRYAAPPLGNLRFRAAQDPVANSSIQHANQHGPICLSVGSGIVESGTSEDCLFLDVYAPSTAHPGKIPVYVFIQGGGYQSNSNANYNGSGLIAASNGNVVIVNFNYRVGPYGFLASKEIVADGDTNVGLKDMRKVFSWVQQHISKFGGDPNHVTIGGDSAGGAAIAIHLTAYGGRNDHLFHATAAESQALPVQLTVAETQYQYDTLVRNSSCKSTSNTLACLRGLSAAQLQEINYNFAVPGGVGIPNYSYASTIDGGLIQDYTYRLFARGKFIHVPAIWGDDTNEGTVFTPTDLYSYQDINSFLLENWPRLTQDQLIHIDTMYPKAEQFPNSGPYWRTGANAYGELRYICPGINLSSVMADAGLQVWYYRFNMYDPVDYSTGLGTPHTEEITGIWGPANVNGGGEKSWNTINKNMVSVLQGYWTSFMQTYDPNTRRAKGTPQWNNFNSNAMPRLMFITNGTKMETVPSDQKCRCHYLSSIGVSIQQ